MFRVVPTTQKQLSALDELLKSGELDVWSKSREVNTPWDIMVNPQGADHVRAALEQHQLDWKVLISDVGR